MLLHSIYFEQVTLIVEHGFQQATPVSDFFSKTNFNNITMHKDLAGNPRCTLGNYL